MEADPISKQPIDLHYWPTPNGFKITIMLEECGLPYNVIYVHIGRGDQFEPEFAKLSPNNRMPAIVDPDGPAGKPISVFESGAILQYLGRKSGEFYGKDERSRIEVEQWLYWQMANLGPMAGQNHHFVTYADENISYAIERYVNEVNRLYGVMNTRLKNREFLADDYSIADMAAFPWTRGHARQRQNLNEFPNVKKWFERVNARKNVQKALEVGKEKAAQLKLSTDPKVRSIMFGQRARAS